MFALVLGLSPTGLYAVRELGRAAIAVAGVAEGLQCGEASRFLSIKPVIRAHDDAGLLGSLRELAQRRAERGLLIPTSDHFIEFVADNEAELSVHYDFQSSYTPERYRAIVDKGRFLDGCKRAEIAFPAFHEVAADELINLVSAVRFPVILKPALIHHVKSYMAGRKVLIARGPGEMQRLAATIPIDAATSWLVQEIVAGPESNITLFSGYVDRNGQTRQPFTARKLRQYPPGFGSASLVVSETLPGTAQAAEHLLASLDFRGIAGVEFKTDSRDGKLNIIEVNPRPSLWFAVGTAAGKCATLAAMRDFSGDEPLPEMPQQNGIVWRYGPKDVYSALWYRWHREDFVLPTPDITLAKGIGVTARIGAVYASDDPGPALREMRNFASKAMMRLGGRNEKGIEGWRTPPPDS